MSLTRRDWEIAFADWVQTGCDPEDILVVEDELHGILWVTAKLLGDMNVMPRMLCHDLGLEEGSTYDDGARDVRDSA